MLKYVVALISVSLALWNGSEWLTQRFKQAEDADRLLSREELSVYNGREGSKGLYLAVLGQVFNVEKGRKHYGPDGGYRFFAGRDASRAFATGDFTDAGLTDDVSDLSPSQTVALYDWLAFYQKDYTCVGKLIGRFYSEDGKPTDVLQQVEASLAEGLKLKAQAAMENELYPACNSEWNPGRGRVWCSNKSGGVNRDWTGVPRRLFSPGSGYTRCVCARPDNPTLPNNPNLKEYKDCPPQAESCPLNPDEPVVSHFS